MANMLSECFWKTNEISLEAQFSENQTKNTRTKNFRVIFGELSVNYLQTNCEPYLNKYSTILVPHLSQIYISKHGKI